MNPQEGGVDNNLTTEHGTAEIEVEEKREEYTFRFSRYYSVMPNQPRYYMGKTYQEDFNMNCSGDPLTTANGHKLQAGEEGKVGACPAEFLNKTIYIEGYGEFKCIDRGGAIVKRGKVVRVDIWAGIGMDGLINIEQNKVYNPGDRQGYILYDYV